MLVVRRGIDPWEGMSITPRFPSAVAWDPESSFRGVTGIAAMHDEWSWPSWVVVLVVDDDLTDDRWQSFRLGGGDRGRMTPR
jgi:hypothetical protein